MLLLLRSVFALLLASLAWTVGSGQEVVQVGDEICVEGYIMDYFCIELGTLLDHPSVVTLEGPDQHTVHCLIEVSSCRASPYEVLLDPLPGESRYARGWRLDDAGKDILINLARTVGACGTCTGEGSLRQGLRAAINGTVLDLGDASTPPTLGVTAATQSFKDVLNVCGYVTSDETSNTNNNSSSIARPPTRIDSGEGSLNSKFYAHASLMLISWGWLLPSGVGFAKLFRHRDPFWFHVHIFCQSLGLLLALAGWILALQNFDVFGDMALNRGKHGVLGCVTMTLGLLQPVNALLRPHVATTSPDQQGKSTARWVWEAVHKSTGYVALVLSVVTIGYGTTLLPKVKDQKTFQVVYAVALGGTLAVLFIVAMIDKKKQQQHRNEDQEKESHPLKEEEI